MCVVVRFDIENLSGSGLAAHLDAWNPGPSTGTALVYYTVHAINHLSDVIRIEFHAARWRYRSIFSEMRLKPHTTD